MHTSALVDFSVRPVKRELEKQNAELATQKGGWFGLTSDEFPIHWDMFSKNLRSQSPFLIAETSNAKLFKLEKQLVDHYFENIGKECNVDLYEGDLFNMLKNFAKEHPNPRVPLFSYGHLDFCRTCLTLVRDEELLENIKWLANWNQLKNTFFFDITFSKRGDLQDTYIDVLEKQIPKIFTSAGWSVSSPRNTYCFREDYKESGRSACMVNALYKVSK